MKEIADIMVKKLMKLDPRLREAEMIKIYSVNRDLFEIIKATIKGIHANAR